MSPKILEDHMDQQPVTYAGFWKRFAAYLIDTILIGAVSFMILIPGLALFGIGVAMSALNDEPSSVVGMIIAAIAGYLVFILVIWIGTWLYFALMESSSKQGTLGKMALGIKVTDLHGNRLTFGRATGRYFAKIISGMTMGIGYIIAGFTERKQALHDLIASCLVVNQ